ncbi:MAG: hypothetical protein K6E87_03015 [bacterium]|nr:hypothetical protein [bacterium]
MFGNIVISIIGLLISFIAIFACCYAKPSETQKYCLITSVSSLVFFLIGIFNVYNNTEAQFILCQKLAYIASTYLTFGFILALSSTFDLKISLKTKLIIAAISLVLVIIYLLCDYIPYWFVSTDLVFNPSTGLYKFVIHGGWMYYLVNILIMLGLITWSIILIVYTFKRRNSSYRYSLFRYLFIFTLAPTFIWILCLTKVISSDFSNMILFILTLMIIIYVEIYFILTKTKLSTSLLFESASFGIIMLDYKKRYIDSNSKAKELLPIIEKNNTDAITAFINVNIFGEEIYNDGKTEYKIKIDNITSDVNPRCGYVIWICDQNKKAS